MPLPSEDWAKGKSGGKARTYMAAGVVPVVAGIGYNLELIEQGKTGWLCGTHQDWTRALEAMITDAQARQEIADAGRAVVETRFAPDLIARQMADLFHEILQDKAQPDGR